MKKLSLSLIAIAVSFSLYNYDSTSYAIGIPKNETSNPQCLINVPKFDRPIVNGDINTLPVNAESDEFEAIYPNLAIYSGDVYVEQGNRTVLADKVTIDSKDANNRMAILDGNITYQDNLIKMKGHHAAINLNNNDSNMNPSEYHLVDRLGRGKADEMKLEKNRYIILKNGSFTSCPVDDGTWNIKGTTVIHDNEEQLLEVWNAVFSIGKVPVLYSPYLQLPTGNKRRSGLLMPTFGYDSIDGIDFALPFYWNIAPNYDATLTPRVLQHRGVQLQTEFRYLNQLGLGTIAFDWLQHDLNVILSSDSYPLFLDKMYGNFPDEWSIDLQGLDRLRYIANALTRMRYCYEDGRLDFYYKNQPDQAPSKLKPWFALPRKIPSDYSIAFGHWAALNGKGTPENIYALDTGCCWGGKLTCLRFEDKKYFKKRNIETN